MNIFGQIYRDVSEAFTSAKVIFLRLVSVVYANRRNSLASINQAQKQASTVKAQKQTGNLICFQTSFTPSPIQSIEREDLSLGYHGLARQSPLLVFCQLLVSFRQK